MCWLIAGYRTEPKESMKHQVTLRFYGNLQQFLPPAQRRQHLQQYWFYQKQLAKDAIGAFHVPLTEVDWLLINSQPATMETPLHPGDYMSVYPHFYQLPLGHKSFHAQSDPTEKRFVLDIHLGKLCTHLRMLGIDCLYGTIDDHALIEEAVSQQRILLTRDVGLLKYRRLAAGYYIRARQPWPQLLEVLSRYPPERPLQPFTRCLRCNGALQAADKGGVQEKIPERVSRKYTQFFQCTQCGQMYWQGSHYRHMLQRIQKVLGAI